MICEDTIRALAAHNIVSLPESLSIYYIKKYQITCSRHCIGFWGHYLQMHNLYTHLFALNYFNQPI